MVKFIALILTTSLIACGKSAPNYCINEWESDKFTENCQHTCQGNWIRVLNYTPMYFESEIDCRK